MTAKTKTRKKKAREPKIQTKWNLKLLYKNMQELDRHVEEIDKAFTRFAKKYQDSSTYLKTDTGLRRALDEHEKLWDVVAIKPHLFLYLSLDLNSEDAAIRAKLNKIEERMSHTTNKTLFFGIAIGNIPAGPQKKFLKSPKLKKYHYYLKKLFENAQFVLSEPEEKILNLKSLTSYSLWTKGVKKVVNKQEVLFKGKKLPFAAGVEKLSSDITITERRKLWGEITTALKGVSDFAEAEINAVVLDKKISDELRGYKYPYSATIRGYENDEEEVLRLVDTVTQHFHLSQRFYKLKQRLLGIKHFEYADRLANIGSIKKKFSFIESSQLWLDTLNDIEGPYKSIFEKMLSRGQIDVFPQKGKKNGAYCSGQVHTPTFVLLNHADNFDSLRTLAHEMGHAFHFELSKCQEPLYQDFTTSVAEVASTFFENLVFEKVFNSLSDKEKITALFEKLDATAATIFRQIAFFNFELELHETIRKKGNMTHEEIADVFNKHMRAYIGKWCTFTPDDGYSFVFVPHFRYMFYVYAYAYGSLISSALYARFKKDPSYLKEIEKFLSAGGSKAPYDIFKGIGIDTKDPKFWKSGLKSIECDIEMLEKLTKKARQ